MRQLIGDLDAAEEQGKEEVTMRVIAFLLTLLPAAAAFGETWTPVGATVQPASRSSLALEFDHEEIRGHGDGGCQYLACQIVLPMSWPHRKRFAERWYGQCVEAIQQAHAASHDWNPRDVKTTGEQQWLVKPKIIDGVVEKPGARYLCYKPVKRAKARRHLPEVSMAPAEGHGAEVFDTGVRSADTPPKPKSPPAAPATIDDLKPADPPAPKPAQAKPLPPVRETNPAPPKITELPSTQRFLRIVFAVCGSGRYDTGYGEFDSTIGCGRLGGELYYEGFVLGAALETMSNLSTAATLGVRGHLSFAIASWFEGGLYGRIAGDVVREDDAPNRMVYDWGISLAFVVFDKAHVNGAFVLDISAGSRAQAPAYTVPGGTMTELDTLGVGLNGAFEVRFAP